MNNHDEKETNFEVKEVSVEKTGAQTTTRRKILTAARDRLRDRRFLLVTFALFAVAILTIVFLFWHRGEEGRPVPAPRNVPSGEPRAPTADEAVLTLAPDQVQRADLKIETVGEQLAAEGVGGATTGVVEANQYRQTPVIAVAGGIVRRVDAQLGEFVRQGRTVAVVFSEELSQAQSRYLALSKELEIARQNYERESKLVRISPVSSAELDAARAKLRTDEAELEEARHHYQRTVNLTEIGAASREELEHARARLRVQEAELAESRRRYDRAVELARLDPVSRSSFEQAAVRLRNAETELASTRERLRLFGLSPQRIAGLRSAGQISSELFVPAPVSGTVTSRSVNPGQVIDANSELLRMTDLSSVWVIAQVYENELARIRVGSGASVRSNAFPDRVFRGTVAYIDPNINPETRTAQVRIELANPGQVLRIGMYVTVAFGSLGDAERTMPVVPAAAVQNVNNQQVVFLATDQPHVFIMRPVRLAAEANGFYPVIEGLTVGDRVVTDGSFLLRAEWLKRNPASQS